MREWIPFIARVFPGSGVNHFTVDAVPFEWWEIYFQLSQNLANKTK